MVIPNSPKKTSLFLEIHIRWWSRPKKVPVLPSFSTKPQIYSFFKFQFFYGFSSWKVDGKRILKTLIFDASQDSFCSYFVWFLKSFAIYKNIWSQLPGSFLENLSSQPKKSKVDRKLNVLLLKFVICSYESQ